MRRTFRLRSLAVVVAAAVITACVISTNTGVAPLAKPTVGFPARQVRTPLKAHLIDGTVVMFPSGAMLDPYSVVGNGTRFDATRSNALPLAQLRVPMDSVLGLAVYDRFVNPGRTLLYSTLTAAGMAAATAGLAVAMFGSCPTIYADSAGIPVLQAESFSFSIAPLLESRDVDRLSVNPDSTGVVRLEVRNEALETHYTDHLELLELRHDPDEYALPLPSGGAVAVRAVGPPASARDRSGRDVRRLIEAADSAVFATDDTVLARAAEGLGPVGDHIDLTVPRASKRDSVALVLRMRSSLLSTTLFYEHMLARPGATALDWVGRDLSSIATVAGLAKWYDRSFGLRIAVLDDGEWREVARVNEAGPTAWRDVAVLLPAVGTDSMRVRLSFVADEWRIDRIALAWDVRRLEARTIPLATVTASDGSARPDVADMLRHADERRLQTEPGQRYRVTFDVGRAPRGTRTYLLAAKGYYVEWVRGRWLAVAKDSVPFTPANGTVREILRSWRASKDSLERHFFNLRVPVI